MNEFEFATGEELETWSIQNIWEIYDQIPLSRQFSEPMLASIGLRTIRRAVAKWDSDQLPFPAFLSVMLRNDLEKSAKDGRFETTAEAALRTLDGGAQ